MGKTKQIAYKENRSVEEKNIDRFISSVFTKNYAAANKYLTAAVSNKIKNRIAKAATQPLF